MEGDRGAGARENRGWEGYGRREKKGREAGEKFTGKVKKTKIRARDKKTALLPVKLETFPSRLHQDMNEIA